MYGKLFERMYTGSMMGCGAMMFAVWPYIIAHMKPNRDRTMFTVELNTHLMALLIGEREADIKKIIAQFCEPDVKSRTPDKEGRKLVKLGTYLYEVVNGTVYDEIRRESELRESNRRRQERHYYKNVNGEANLPDAPVNPPAVAPAVAPVVVAEKPAKRNPTLDEVKLVVAKSGLPESDAVWFWNKCEGNGWKNAGQPIKSWPHMIASWKAAGYLPSQKNGASPVAVAAQGTYDANTTNYDRFPRLPNGDFDMWALTEKQRAIAVRQHNA